MEAKKHGRADQFVRAVFLDTKPHWPRTLGGPPVSAVLTLGLVSLLLFGAPAQADFILDLQKLSDTQGNFTGILDDADLLRLSVTSLGDLDGDEITDIAIGAVFDDDGATDAGAVWILFLNADGSVIGPSKDQLGRGKFHR